ncbi:hypothetical protein Nepgr_025727 [Nepenthes gracilis]|uniref:U5 small nuclear ribonucleoprotein TSSC4 n=1 Tax=Nepenthes gracilis TaxID=150966 RepID=A0AAD3T7G6_NEPGR|nr:hypothetical protein Nepgr_025727 [Nepenthes gracilis]
MEDSFRVRVERAFGSLSSSSSSASSQPLSSSLWSLTDDDIEKREWNRRGPDDGDDDIPYPSNVDGFFAKHLSAPDEAYTDSKVVLGNDLQDFDDLDDDDVVEGGEEQRLRASSRRSHKPEDYGDDEWEVKSSIGLDCTLDYEEEEDEYDRVAVGREKASDSCFMSDDTDYVPHITRSYIELPSTFMGATRDPRANRLAAKIRLKEDAEAAQNFNYLLVSNETVAANPNAQISTVPSDDGNISVKSILKRKENQMDSKSEKRVRFDPGCKNHVEEESKGDRDVSMHAYSNEETIVSEAALSLLQDSFAVPDYIQNPSKYTHYTFDSTSDVDEQSNRQAYMDVLTALRRSRQLETEEARADLSKPVIFSRRQKDGDASSGKSGNDTEQKKGIAMEECNMHKKSLPPLSFGDGNMQGDEVLAMEEDEPKPEATKVGSRLKAARQYRSKVNSQLDE